jgi:uncharacterized protein YecA (UPF0149 family)
MKQITFEDIKDTIVKLAEGSEDKYFSELDKLNQEQPAVVEFLLSRDELNEDEMDVLQHSTQVAWYIVKKTLKRKNKISEDYLYEQFDRNYVVYIDNIISKDEGDDLEDDDSSISEELHKPNNQPVLVDYLAGIIIESVDDPDSPLREAMGSAMILDLKTVIDCLVIGEEKALAEVCDKKYSEKSFQSISESVEVYTGEFKKSSYYMKLNHKEKDEAQAIIRNFSEMMYHYFLMVPANWNARRAVVCLSEIMPSKVVADNSYFEAVEPVMTAFLTFCGDKGYVTEGKIIARRLLGITTSIIEELDNEENWSPGKLLIKEAEKKGVDISDKNQLESFIKEYNKDKISLFQSEAEKKAEKPGRNDPCPCGSGKKYKKCCGADE